MAARIAIVEDTETIADELERVIKTDPDLTCIGKFGSAELAIRKLPALMPDLCILDIGLPGMNGIAALKILKKKLPQMKIVVFTVFEDSEYIIDAIQNGASGYLLKDTDRKLLCAELKVMLQGGATLTPRVALKISQLVTAESQPVKAEVDLETPQNLLTERQINILNHIALGFDYKEIADELDISEHTVRRHIENIYERLEVNSKNEAIRAGHKLGFLKNIAKWVS
jgi:DNA-binding NarL/FixJ family response regulator